MEFLAVVLLLIIFGILLSFKSSVNDNFRKLENELNDLRKLIARNITDNKSAISTESLPISKKEAVPKKDYWESNFKVQEEPIPAKPFKEPEATT